MKKKFFVVAAAFFSSHLFAQDTTYQPLDEVIITANKVPQKQSSTGKVITVISKEQIEKSSGRTISQLLNEQAGITINGALNNLGTNQSVYMRGASAGRTLILLDGIPVYDPSLINNEFDLNLVSLNNVERVEICRGAQSTLYGSDAVAGVINIITVKKDVAKPFNVSSTLSAGNKSTFRGNVQLFGRAGKLTYTTRYARLSTKGFSAAYDEAGNKNFDRDGYRSNAASAALQFQATQALSFKTFLQYNRYTTDIDASAFTDEKDFVTKSKNVITGAGFHFGKNNVALTGNYQYSDVTRNNINDSADVPGFTKYSADDYFGKNQYLEVYANIGLGSGFSFLQGADYRYSSMNNQFLSVSSFGPFTSQFRDTVQSQASLFASLFYNAPNEKLNAELGARMNVHSRYGSNSTYTFNPSYNFNEHFRLFGSMATGFKAPSLYQLYSSYGQPNLKAEKSTNYEAGLQQQHGQFKNRLVYFHRIIKNGIDFNNIVFQYFNFNRQKVNGFEWESAFQPDGHFNITINYTYLNPEEKTQSRITFKDTMYEHLLRRPQHHLNIQASYQFDLGLYLSLSGNYVSKRYDAGGYKVPDALLKSYFILNAYAEYKFKKYIKLFIDQQNLTGKKFFDVRGYNSIPYLINAGVTFNW